MQGGGTRRYKEIKNATYGALLTDPAERDELSVLIVGRRGRVMRDRVGD